MRVVLTGAGSGIGHALALMFRDRGDQLVLLVRSAERAAAMQADFPAAEFVVADLAEPGTLHGLGREIEGTVDALVHCAGVVALAPVGAARLDSWEHQLAVNLLAPAVVTRELLPALRASLGSVVFVNSTAGLTAGAGWSAYSASKFGLRALAESLRAEEPAVRVATVYPGRTATPMQQMVHKQEGRTYDPSQWTQPETVAASILGVLDMPPDATVTDVMFGRPRPREKSQVNL